MKYLGSISDAKDLVNKEYVDGRSGVTGVKGSSESSYRTGNVSLTAANVGAAASSHTHNQTRPQAITIQTGSSAQQHITLQTLMTWLITTKGYIPSGTNCHLVLSVSWSYEGNDILQLSAHGTNYEIQLAGCQIEFIGNATNYNSGVFRLKIHTSPTDSFTVASGYTKIPTASIAEYFCNGSGYSPTWKIYTVGAHTVLKDVPSDAKFTDTTYSSKAASSGGTDVSLVTTGEKHTWNNMVPTSRKVNNKALSADITLSASDVGAATSGHTHATTIATSTGTNQITLSHGAKYSITAGGTSYVFTMPSAPSVPSITLNGSSTTSPSFYAPTSAGTSGYYLKSNGSGAPTWAAFPSIPTIPSNNVTGSGTSGQLAQWNGAHTITSGPKVTVSTSGPSGGINGDIWFVHS